MVTIYKRASFAVSVALVVLIAAVLQPREGRSQSSACDFNRDGSVNVTDLGILLSAWGGSAASLNGCGNGGIVDVVELGALMSAWSQSGGGNEPTAVIVSPANGMTVRAQDVTVEFSVLNWTVGGKGSNHIHFHLDGSPDHFMFYNAPDNTVELNTAPGAAPQAAWVAPNKLTLKGLAVGPHTLRAHLATPSHTPPGNPEADVSVSFTVNPSLANVGNTRVESQTWWMESCQHTHMTVEVPWEQEVKGQITANVRDTTHLFDERCQHDELFVEDENGARLATVTLNPPITCSSADCAYSIPVVIDTNAFVCDGQHILNFRIVSRFNQVDKDERLSTANEIPIVVNNGKAPCAPQTPRRSQSPYLTGLGFHQTAGYACAEIRNAPLGPVRQPHTFEVRACDGSKNITVSLNRQSHPIPGVPGWDAEAAVNGTVVFTQDGNFQKPFALTIDPASLPPGRNWITVQTIDPDFMKETYDSRLHHVRSNARLYFTVPSDVGKGGTPRYTLGAPVASPASQQVANPGAGLQAWSASNGTAVWIANGQLQTQGRSLASVNTPRGFANRQAVAMDGTKIAYAAGDSNADLFLYDLSTNSAQVLANQAGMHESGPSVSGSDVAYAETPVSGGYAKIVLINTATNVKKTVSSAQAQPSSAPDTAAGYVAWADKRHDGNGDIYLYDPLTGQEYRLTSHPGTQREPAIDAVNGRVYIAWADDRNGLCGGGNTDCSNGSDIYMCEYNPATHACPERRVTYTTRSGKFDVHIRRFPSIDYPWVAFQDTRNGMANPDIFAIELTTGEEWAVASSLEPQLHAVMDGTAVFYDTVVPGVKGELGKFAIP